MNTSEKIMTVIMLLLLPILAFAVIQHNKAAQPFPQVEMPMPKVEKPCPEDVCPPPSDEVGKDVGNPGDEVPGYQPPPERRIFKGRIKQRLGY